VTVPDSSVVVSDARFYKEGAATDAARSSGKRGDAHAEVNLRQTVFRLVAGPDSRAVHLIDPVIATSGLRRAIDAECFHSPGRSSAHTHALTNLQRFPLAIP
jgi:hypothetical protein